MAARHFNNLGYIQTTVSVDKISTLLAEIKSIGENWNSAELFHYGLIGNIAKEYVLKDSRQELEQLVMPSIIEYNQHFKYPGGLDMVEGPHKLVLDRPWVNFQKAHEYNPPHGHSGVMSFVIWIKIPYSRASELAACPDIPDYRNVNGMFAFLYTDSLGTITQEFLPLDSNWEYQMVVFPSQLRHTVYAFCSSQEYRISVAGNFIFRAEKG